MQSGSLLRIWNRRSRRERP